MAKGYLISDIHLGVHRLAEDKWLKIAKQYFYEFFIPKVQEKWEDGDKIFILGDLFDNRSHLSLKVISFALDLFNDFEKLNLPVLIIGGNHDYYNNNDSEHTSLRILEKHENVIIEHGITQDGNLLKKENLLYCFKKYKNTCDIITGDGGFDFSIDFNTRNCNNINIVFFKIKFFDISLRHRKRIVTKFNFICLIVFFKHWIINYPTKCKNIIIY